jgi:hypothetical protein
MLKNKDRYLDLMNLTPREAYKRVKDMASYLTDDEHLIRSCIFDLHAAVEIELKRIIYHTFKAQLFLTNDEKKNQKTIAKFHKMIRRLGFSDMYRILEPIFDSWSYPDLKSIQNINEVRNAVAHGNAMDHVDYKGRNPFKDVDCFAQIFFDVDAIKRCLARYFDFAIEGPRAQLRRYVKKYGSGELF